MINHRFQSIFRENIWYQVGEWSDTTLRGSIGIEVGEYDTLGDGATQHTPVYPVRNEHVLDYMASLATYARDNISTYDDMITLWPCRFRDRNLVELLMSIKYNPDKPTYINPQTYKKSTSPTKRHDRRWIEVPSWYKGWKWQDGGSFKDFCAMVTYCLTMGEYSQYYATPLMIIQRVVFIKNLFDGKGENAGGSIDWSEFGIDDTHTELTYLARMLCDYVEGLRMASWLKRSDCKIQNPYKDEKQAA